MNKASAIDQRGQTIALVAVAMVSFVAMGALAIDLTSLYSARGEIQRAADAAALAGAKAFVDSGVTTDPGNSNLQSIATTMAQSYATGAAAQNLVAKGAVQLVPANPVPDFSLLGNPRITVTLQRTGLPLFFARIWGSSFASVSATAVAEAYNPSYSQLGSTSFLPSAPKCVKPLLLPNNDPVQSGHPVFVDTATGAVNTGTGQLIGEQVSLKTACNPGGGAAKGCNLPPGKGSGFQPPNPGEYLPMVVGTVHQYCHGASAQGCTAGGTDFEQSIECCDGTTFSFPQCGTSTTLASWDPAIDPRGIGSGASPVQSGLQCLIHSNGGNSQQDSMDPSKFASGTGPLLISPGTFSQTRYGLSSGAIMGTSDSIVTVPLFDNSGASLPDNHQLTIVGFLTLFVNGANAGNGDFSATIMNVTGCGNSPSSAAPVSGGGVSAIPVRLIHN
jgi:hypothetical protein